MENLPAAAASLLEKFSVNPEKLNGDAIPMAAWVVYAQTQPRLKNPVGYAHTRIKNGEHPAPVFVEIASIGALTWDEIIETAPHEQRERKHPGLGNSANLWQEMESVSDEAVAILAKIADEVSHDRKR